MAFFQSGRKRPEEIEQEKKQQLRKELHELKIQFIIKLLTNSNGNLEAFLKSSMYNNPNTYDLIEHAYGKIFGYDFSYKTEKFETKNGRWGLKIVEDKKENGSLMNLNELKIVYKDNSLIISDSQVVYQYEMDEHYLIYLNKEKLSLGSYIPTDEEIRESRQDLYDTMQSYKKRHDEAMIASMEFAKTYHVG